ARRVTRPRAQALPMRRSPRRHRSEHMPSHPDLDRIAHDFLTEMQACVRAVDFERGRGLFAEDVVAFGTFAAVVSGRDWVERGQWRNVWPNIREFTFRLEELHCLGTADALCVVVPWDSLGHRADGATF